MINTVINGAHFALGLGLVVLIVLGYQCYKDYKENRRNGF